MFGLCNSKTQKFKCEAILWLSTSTLYAEPNVKAVWLTFSLFLHLVPLLFLLLSNTQFLLGLGRERRRDRERAGKSNFTGLLILQKSGLVLSHLDVCSKMNLSFGDILCRNFDRYHPATYPHTLETCKLCSLDMAMTLIVVLLNLFSAASNPPCSGSLSRFRNLSLNFWQKAISQACFQSIDPLICQTLEEQVTFSSGFGMTETLFHW